MSDNRPKCPNTPKYPCGDCPVCQVPPEASPRLWPWPPGFRESWPTREAIAAHQGGTGRWLVTDPYGVKTLGAFDGDTFHVLMRWHVVGAMVSEPTQPWKFEPYWKDTFTDEINRQRDKRDVEVAAIGLHETTLGGFYHHGEVELLRRHYERALGPPATSDSPGQPQAPTPPQGPAAGPGIAPGRQEIARRRADARRWLAENEAAAERLLVELASKGRLPAGAGQPPRDTTVKAMTGDLERQQDALKALNLRPLTKADSCPRCDEYVVPCPKCPASGSPKASPLVTESLGSGMEAPVFKDEHVQMSLDARELAAVKAELALTTQSLVDVTNKLNEATLRIRDLKAAVRNEDKYAVPVGPAGFENDRIGRVDHTARILSPLPDRSPDRRVLVVLRGLPGSGKSTVAQAIADSDPGRWVRVSKDDVRQMMVGPSGDLFRFVEDRAREVVVAKTAEEMTMSALRLGLDVVVDATNLTNRALGAWRMAAMVVNRDGHGPVLICERAVPTPVEECVARDARRGARSVGRAVIERLAATIDVPLEDRNQEVGQ